MIVTPNDTCCNTLIHHQQNIRLHTRSSAAMHVKRQSNMLQQILALAAFVLLHERVLGCNSPNGQEIVWGSSSRYTWQCSDFSFSGVTVRVQDGPSSSVGAYLASGSNCDNDFYFAGAGGEMGDGGSGSWTLNYAQTSRIATNDNSRFCVKLYCRNSFINCRVWLTITYSPPVGRWAGCVCSCMIVPALRTCMRADW